MNVNPTRTFVVAFAVVLIPTIANAFYAAHMGRWTSRDPYGQMGRIGTEMMPGVESRVRFASRDTVHPMAQYHDGMNLYQYVMSNPANRIDPIGLESFYSCERDIGAGGGIGDATARGCGCQHRDIYGDESGPIRIGGGGAAIGGEPGLPKGPGWKCIKMPREYYDVTWPSPWPIIREKKLGHGPGAGKSCKDATSAEIKACLAAAPKPPGNPGLINNCQTDVYYAAEECCLNGPPPLAIAPPDLPYPTP